MDIVIFVSTIIGMFSLLIATRPPTIPGEVCDQDHHFICNNSNSTTQMSIEVNITNCCCRNDTVCTGCNLTAIIGDCNNSPQNGYCARINLKSNQETCHGDQSIESCWKESGNSTNLVTNPCIDIHMMDCSTINSDTLFSCVRLISSQDPLTSLTSPSSSSSLSQLSLISSSSQESLISSSSSTSQLSLRSSSSSLQLSPSSLLSPSPLQSHTSPSNTITLSSTGLQAIYYLVGSIIFLFSVTIVIFTIVITVKIMQRKRSGALVINSTNSPRNKGMDQSDTAYYTECGPIVSPVYGLQMTAQTYEEPIALMNQQHKNAMIENGRDSVVESCTNRAYEPSTVDPANTEEELKKNIYETVKSPEDSTSEGETVPSRRDEYISLSEVTISNDSLHVEDARQDLLYK